jgi:integrase/recombinase XerD
VPVIPPGLLPGRGRRAVPYLYSDRDLTALLRETATLKTPLRTATMRTLIGLLAVTGIRLGEALSADDEDFDAQSGVLLVRHGKFGKQRLLPLHPSTVTALNAYRELRDAWFLTPASPALLVSQAGTRLLIFNVGLTFARLARRAGLVPRSPSCRPRPHDLRHTFAVRTLLGWYRDGGDIDARLPLLSTYLGHVSPKNTYWYLDAAPELMAQAAQRLQAAGGPS